MRRKIETEERDSTTRASFICTQCKKTYTDLEADQLYDLTTGGLRCHFCGDILEEESSALPQADSRLVLAKFNEQIEPLYLLLKEVEDLKLPAELLEPEPLDVVMPGEYFIFKQTTTNTLIPEAPKLINLFLNRYQKRVRRRK